MKVESSIIIQASIHKVWEALIAVQQYHGWNPFIIEVKSTNTPPTEGAEMKFTIEWKDGSRGTSKELVTSFVPPSKVESYKEAEWSYRFASFLSVIGMIKATRFHMLTSEKEGETSYYTFEEFRGWGIKFLPIAKVQDGFDRQTKALKRFCEK